jgi:hypothetical protein
MQVLDINMVIHTATTVLQALFLEKINESRVLYQAGNLLAL